MAMVQETTTTVIVTAADLDYTSSDPTVVATDGLNKWFMYNDTNDTIDNTLGTFIVGPDTPPHGRGSVQFTLGPSPYDRKNIATYQFSGTPLASITEMSFSVYSHSGVAGPTESPFLNFNVDFTGSSPEFQGRLVYVPSANGAVPQDTWNTFDAITCGYAKWTWSHYASNGNKWPDNNTSQYRTWNDIKASFPDARLLPVGGWLGIRVGEPGPTGYTANIDSFTWGTATTGTTIFDFEPTPILFARAFGLQSTNPTNGPFGDVSIPPTGGDQTATVSSAIIPPPLNIVATGITDTASGALMPAPVHVNASSVLTSLLMQGIIATGINVTAHADLSTLNGVVSGGATFATFIGDGLIKTGYAPGPNTVMTLPQGTLTLNEQTIVQQANDISIVVNGLHLQITQGPQAGADVVVGHAEATITFA
jgi:hypothetical protein